MLEPPPLFGIPRQILQTVEHFPAGDGEVQVRFRSVLYINVGEDENQKQEYIAWCRRAADGTLSRPIRTFDISVGADGNLEPVIADGEVVDTSPPDAPPPVEAQPGPGVWYDNLEPEPMDEDEDDPEPEAMEQDNENGEVDEVGEDVDIDAVEGAAEDVDLEDDFDSEAEADALLADYWGVQEDQADQEDFDMDADRSESDRNSSEESVEPDDSSDPDYEP